MGGSVGACVALTGAVCRFDRCSVSHLADLVCGLCDPLYWCDRQLEVAKDEALIEMKRVQARLAADRRSREKELAERQAEVTNARKMEEWRLQRENIRQEMAAELRGDLSADQEARLMAALSEKEAGKDGRVW